MYGGHVRNSLFGGGEIAAVGRGVIEVSGEKNSIRTLQGIYKAGHTSVKLYDGYVHRNVFGGGRGYNNLGEGGSAVVISVMSIVLMKIQTALCASVRNRVYAMSMTTKGIIINMKTEHGKQTVVRRFSPRTAKY